MFGLVSVEEDDNQKEVRMLLILVREDMHSRPFQVSIEKTGQLLERAADSKAAQSLCYSQAKKACALRPKNVRHAHTAT